MLISADRGTLYLGYYALRGRDVLTVLHALEIAPTSALRQCGVYAAGDVYLGVDDVLAVGAVHDDIDGPRVRLARLGRGRALLSVHYVCEHDFDRLHRAIAHARRTRRYAALGARRAA